MRKDAGAVYTACTRAEQPHDTILMSNCYFFIMFVYFKLVHLYKFGG